MKTTFFNQFAPAQLRQAYVNSLNGLKKCYSRSLKTGKYNGKPSDFWSEKVRQYEAIIKEMK